MGDHDAIRKLVASGAPVDEVFDIGLDPGAYPTPATPLMIAAGSGDGATVETTRLLIELGADPRQTIEARFATSAAEFACWGLGWNYRPGGDAERLRVLLAAGSPLRVQGTAATRLVFQTAALGKIEILGTLLAPGAGAHDEPDPDLARATQRFRGKGTGVRSFLEIPLFAAAASGVADCAAQLLGAGARVDERDSMGSTALCYARSSSVARVLLQAGADIHSVDHYGRDVLDTILEGRRFVEGDSNPNGPFAAAAEVCKAGAVVNRRDKRGVPRLVAYCANHMFCCADGVRVLVRHGADVTLTTPEGATALHSAASGFMGAACDGHRDVVASRVQLGIPVDARDSFGRTPLMHAVSPMNARAYTPRLLLDLGADPNAKDSQGCTPLMLAGTNVRQPDVFVTMLLDAGASPHAVDSEGRSALDHALAGSSCSTDGECRQLPAEIQAILDSQASKLRGFAEAKQRAVERLRSATETRR